MVKSTRKTVPWKGWSKMAPNDKQRTKMYRKCGKKCFLGTRKRGAKHPDFPICKKNTCKVSSKGLWAAYIRAKQWGKSKKSERPTRKRAVYTSVARRAKRMLKKLGKHMGK
jgi:hypothetical protein